MKLAIDETRCKGCNLCTKVCPYRIFREGTRPNLRGIVVPELDRPERCTNCRLRHLYGRSSAASASSPVPTRPSTGLKRSRTNPTRWRLNIDVET